MRRIAINDDVTGYCLIYLRLTPWATRHVLNPRSSAGPVIEPSSTTNRWAFQEMAKQFDFQWQIPVPEFLLQGAYFDRWEEVRKKPNIGKLHDDSIIIIIIRSTPSHIVNKIPRSSVAKLPWL